MEVTSGRRFLEKLPCKKDIIKSIEQFCHDKSIHMAAFSIMGAVSSYTIGTYDQRQQVYVTYTETAPREIVSCRGNILIQEGKPVICAKIILADEQGEITGGHLFSETTLFAGEIDIQELKADSAEKIYDAETGLMTWK